MRGFQYALLAAVAAFGFASVASAADLPVKAPVAPFSWSGIYIGVNGGYASSGRERAVNVDETFATLPFFNADVGSLRMSGGFAGFQIGQNVQLGRMVVGLEADFQWGNINGSSSATLANYLAPGGTLTVGTSNAVSRFGTVRPRIGYAWDRTLIYATGGAAWGQIRHTLNSFDSFGFRASGEKTTSRFGYSVGGGVEYAFFPNLSAKIEYQYINLGTINHKEPQYFGAAPTAFSSITNTRTDFHTVRAGLNYRFGTGATQASALDASASANDNVGDWTGLYIGGHLGSSWSTGDAVFPGGTPAAQIAGVPGQGFSTYNDSKLAGFHFGYQHQFGRLVVGAEAAYTLLVGESNFTQDLCPKQTIALFNCFANIDKPIRSAGGRLGWSMGTWLPYASGGYADTQFHGKTTNRSLAPANVTIIDWDSRTHGWYLGGGVDWTFAPGWSLGVDYRHYRFNSTPAVATAVVGGTPGTPLPNDNANFAFKSDSVTMRFTYNFGGLPFVQSRN